RRMAPRPGAAARSWPRRRPPPAPRGPARPCRRRGWHRGTRSRTRSYAWRCSTPSTRRGGNGLVNGGRAVRAGWPPPSAGSPEVQVRLGGGGAALALVLRAHGGTAVRGLGGTGEPEQAQLADLHPGPQRDGQVRHVRQLEGDVAVEPGVDEAGGGV